MPKRFLLIAGAFLISVLMYVDRACISAAKGNIAKDLSLDDIQMGWVIGAFTLGYAFLQVPGGAIADRFGPRIAMTIVCVAWSIFTMLTGAVRGFASMVATRFLFGAGEAGGYPTITRAFASWLPISERGIANSISFSGGRLGAALAFPLVVGAIEYFEGWRTAFYVFGACGLVIAALWYVLFRNTPEEHPAVSEAERDYIISYRTVSVSDLDDDASSGGASDSSGEDPYVAPREVSPRIGAVNMALICFQYMAHNFTFFFVIGWFFPYLKETYKLTQEQTAWYAAAPLLCGVAGNWLAGFTVDMLYRQGKWRLSRRLPAMLGFVFAAIGMSLCIHMTKPGLAVACMCVAIFGADMIISPSWSTCMDIGGKNAGKVSGTMNMVGNLGAFTTSLAFPYLKDWYGSHEPFFYLAAGMNVVSIIAWLFIRPDQSIGSHDNAEDAA